MSHNNQLMWVFITGMYLIHKTEQSYTHSQTLPEFEMFFCEANIRVYKTNYPSVHSMHTKWYEQL